MGIRSNKALLSEEEAELQRLAHEIALCASSVVVESICMAAPIQKSDSGEIPWYSLSQGVRRIEIEDLTTAVRYLELRDALEHHPRNSNLIRVTSPKRAISTTEQKPGGCNEH